MLTKINIDGFNIYTNQIIHPKEFEELYKKERTLISFKTKVSYSNRMESKPLFTFLAHSRHRINIKEGEYVIFRAVKSKNKFEFIAKINKWGRIHLHKEVIQTLNIKNHDKIEFEVVQSGRSVNHLPGYINLSEIKEKTTIILIKNNFITIIKKRTTPITLPQYIKITPDLIELCYLIHGDGHYNTKLFFVNKEADLIHFVLDKFEEILRIPKRTWRARLLFNNSASQELAKEKWKIKLELKEEQFYPSISKSILNTSPFGNLRIVIDKLIVACVFRNIFEAINYNISEGNAIYALNGLLVAEGSAEKTKDGGLHKVTINYSSKEKEMFKFILAKAKIIDLVQDRRDRFVIEGWTNCYKFFKIFFSNKVIPFDLHNGRCNNALSGFLEHGFTKTMGSYLNILVKKEHMNTNEIIKETQYLGSSVIKLLKNKKYNKFTNIEGRGINRSPLVFSITPEGKEFLALTKDIKEVYNEKCRFG